MLQLRASAKGPSPRVGSSATHLSSSDSVRGRCVSHARRHSSLLPIRPYLHVGTGRPSRPAVQPLQASSKPESNGTGVSLSLDQIIDMDVFDQEKESSRRYRRTVFDFPRWRAHRSAQRYVRHIQGLFGSRIVRGLSGPLYYTFFIATFLGIYESLLASHVLPADLPSLSVTASQPFSLSSFALSLLLVFRTNSSYNRWWEARKLWGGVVNRSRDIVRQGVTFFDDEEDAALLQLLRRWTVAFVRSLTAHLREEHDLPGDLKDVLPPDELAALLASPHRPNYCLGVRAGILSMLSGAVRASTVHPMARTRMDENFTFYEDALGACERILKTPIPLTYTRHTSRFLVIYVTFMPFTLWSACGWGAVPASVIIAFLLLGIEEIGVQIEEPFGILPLEKICDTIEANVTSLVEDRYEMSAMVDGLAGKPDRRSRRIPEQYDIEAKIPSLNGSISMADKKLAATTL